MNAIDLNVNSAQCLYHQNSWGHDTVFNICNHTQTVIPWGGVDTAFAVVGLSALALALVGIVGIACSLVDSVYDYYKYGY